ncbi:zinc finger protein 839 isoform X2 [Heterocephalus glaber]|uniref:Zinc finger protein 839 isoform X2 n=1 Tax=Heterocephalus glaber TaxID=10181 RepID=A0AAX6NU38_HETGA|nr:zinc finger protein 839 isoform X2 [Heterocephalus glaber]
MADAEPGTEGGSEHGGGGGRAPPGQGRSAAHVAPLGPEQLQRVLEQVTRAQPPPPFVLQDAARRLRDVAQLAALQRPPGAEPPLPPRLLPPQQLEAICVRVTSGDKGHERPVRPLATIRPQTGGQRPLPGSRPSPVGLGVQPVAPGGPVPAKRAKAAPAPGGLGTTPTPLPASDPPSGPPAVSGSAHSSPAGWHTERVKKLKKSLKVKTRSGRVSRPPKYKAKDYKFIKTEDLADGRPSDSDDYSELSAGDEEEQQDPQALFAATSCALQPRAFRCPTCDKAYIGQGGLARHWRLNPGHSSLQPAPFPEKGHTEASTGRLASLAPPTLLAPCQDRAETAQGGPQNAQCTEGVEAMVLEQDNKSHSALGFPRGDAEGPAESGTAIIRSGAAQPSGGQAVAAGPSTCRSRARLQESLQQCGPEDLVELVLPQLAQVVTVYEFLLAKTKEGRAGQPHFPAVYKEFEELHRRVKAMCEEHLSRAGPASPDPLEVSAPQVAESLGITEFLRKTEAHPDYTGAQCHSLGRAGPRPEEAGSWQGAAQEVPAARKPQQAPLPSGGPEHPAAHGAAWEIPEPGVPTASEGFTPPRSEGSRRMTVSNGDLSVSHPGPQLKVCADSEARCGSAGPAVLCGDSCGPAPCAQLREPKESDPDSGATPGSPGVCSTPSPEAAGAEPGRPGAGPMAPPFEIAAMDIRPEGCAGRTDPAGLPLTTGSHAQDLQQLLRGMEVHLGQGGLEHVVAVRDAVGFEITNGSPEVLSEAQEQIFIQAADGLLLPHAGSVVTPESAVLVTGIAGRGLHVGPLEGTPLPVQAEPSQ